MCWQTLSATQFNSILACSSLPATMVSAVTWPCPARSTELGVARHRLLLAVEFINDVRDRLPPIDFRRPALHSVLDARLFQEQNTSTVCRYLRLGIMNSKIMLNLKNIKNQWRSRQKHSDYSDCITPNTITLLIFCMHYDVQTDDDVQ